MNRRSFIKAMLGSGLVSVGNCVFRVPLMSSAHATPTNLPTLVVIFQRGGCDGLNTVVPYADDDYYNLRPTIAIPPAGSAAPGPAALDLDGFFGLHPSMSSLMPIYNALNMAVLPTVHYPNPSRSHFTSQHYIESGISTENLGGADIDNLDGWINRHLQVIGSNFLPLQAVGFGGSLAQSLRGNIPVQSFSTINSFNLGLTSTDEQSLINNVLPIYQEPSPLSSYRQLVHQYGETLFGNLDAINVIDTSTYIPENGAIYPNSSFGRRLRETAQLIKSPYNGLEVVTHDTGGYDTHSNQGAADPNDRLSRRLQEFSDGIAALVTDLGNKMDDVIILTKTEFGRTAEENGSGGTDHGNAASWFAFGNQIQGGIYLNGSWPGLSDGDLYQGRYLASTVDYRDILGDILFNHLGHSISDLETLLPGHIYQPLGLVSS